MANGYLSCNLVGNLGRDPEMRYTPNGHPVTNFSLAINSRVREGQDWGEATMWVRVTAWGNLAEICNRWLQKGSLVLVEVDRFDFDHATGDPKIFNRQDGSAGAKYEVTARNVRFLNNVADNGGESAFDDEEEAIPFT
jgi:single-strand DNA-binding protein